MSHNPGGEPTAILQAVELTEIEMKWGASSPRILRCNDDQLYLVKFTDDVWGARGCANEVIVRRLAEELGLAVPPGGIVYVPQALVKGESSCLLANGRHASGGLHFGCRFYARAQTAASAKVFEKVQNKDDLAVIIGLDHWVYNKDRADRQDNLLVARVQQQLRAIPIDFGLSFGSDLWSIDDLEQLQDIEQPFDFQGECYRLMVQHIPKRRLHPFSTFMTRMGALSTKEIKDAVDEVPEEWGVRAYERKRLVEFLDQRREITCKILERIVL